MKNASTISALVGACAATIFPPPASAQYSAGHDQLDSGEPGYKVGCSAAAAYNIPSCGELPSGRKFLQDKNSLPAAGGQKGSSGGYMDSGAGLPSGSRGNSRR